MPPDSPHPAKVMGSTLGCAAGEDPDPRYLTGVRNLELSLTISASPVESFQCFHACHLDK